MFEKVTSASEKLLNEFHQYTNDLYWETRIRKAEKDGTDDDLWDCFKELKDAGLIVYDDGDDLIFNVRVTVKGKGYFKEKGKNFAGKAVDTVINKIL